MAGRPCGKMPGTFIGRNLTFGLAGALVALDAKLRAASVATFATAAGSERTARGAAAGEEYAPRGFRLADGQRCGDHDVRGYLDRREARKRVFARLAAGD